MDPELSQMTKQFSLRHDKYFNLLALAVFVSLFLFVFTLQLGL